MGQGSCARLARRTTVTPSHLHDESQCARLVSLARRKSLTRSLAMISAPPAPMTRDLELEALQDAARWPHTAPSTILVLAGRFLARGRDQDAYVYFRERAEAEPAMPLFRALEGQFQVRLASQVSSSSDLPGLTRSLIRRTFSSYASKRSNGCARCTSSSILSSSSCTRNGRSPSSARSSDPRG